MKKFFGKYSYNMVKMYITQVAIGLFGAVLAMATSTANEIFQLVVSIFAILFYMFLIYTTAWEIGAKDRISIDVGKLKRRPWLGFVISLIANLPNFIIATVYTVCWFVGQGAPGTSTNVGGAMRLVTMVTEGMYYGTMSALPFGEVGVVTKLFQCWWMYFLIIIPAVLVCGISYWLGTKNWRVTKLMDPVYPDSDRDKKPPLFKRDDN